MTADVLDLKQAPFESRAQGNSRHSRENTPKKMRDLAFDWSFCGEKSYANFVFQEFATAVCMIPKWCEVFWYPLSKSHKTHWAHTIDPFKVASWSDSFLQDALYVFGGYGGSGSSLSVRKGHEKSRGQARIQPCAGGGFKGFCHFHPKTGGKWSNLTWAICLMHGWQKKTPTWGIVSFGQFRDRSSIIYIYIYIIVCTHDISWCTLWQLPVSCWMQKCWGGPPSPVISPLHIALQEGRKIVRPKIGHHRYPSWKPSSILLKVTCCKTQEMPTSLCKTCLKTLTLSLKTGSLLTTGLTRTYPFWSPTTIFYRLVSEPPLF